MGPRGYTVRAMTNASRHRLAAILAADVVGYSRLISADEAATLAAMRAHRAELWDPTTEAFGGRLVGTAGDSRLVEFPSAVAAVECAAVIQRAMLERNAAVPEDRRIRLRIGVNLGEVVVDGEDIHGDGVNVAARLEGEAEADGICISDDVMRQVRGRLDLAFVDGGTHRLKNIDRAVSLWRWREGGDGAEDGARPRGEAEAPATDSAFAALLAAITRPTIAVLPFTNMSANPELDFFCDGLTETLITDLSRLSRLAVAARNSSFALKGRALDAREAGAALSVRHLIEGGIQAMGNRIRVNVQLIDTTSGEHLWADRIDRGADDLFSLQDEICNHVLAEVDILISAGETARGRHRGTDNAETRNHLNRSAVEHAIYSPDSLARAQQHTDKAVALDPDYHEAISMAALMRAVRELHGWAGEDEDLLNEALDLANRAVRARPDAGNARGVRGYAYLVAGAYETAISDLVRAVELAPNSGGIRVIYARALLAVGRIDDAYDQILQAVRIQPNVFSFSLIVLGVVCLVGGRTANALATFAKCRDLDMPEQRYGPWLAAAHVAGGDLARAREIVANVLEVHPNLTASDVAKPYPMTDDGHRRRLVSLLEEAGLPPGREDQARAS